MSSMYIRFQVPNDQKSDDDQLPNSIKKALLIVLKKILSKANPDYDDKITEVKYWLVEIDNETGIPEREIGLDSNDHAIMKMPHKNNYGYWTDNNLLLSDFNKHFVVNEIREEIFEDYWNLLD